MDWFLQSLEALEFFRTQLFFDFVHLFSISLYLKEPFREKNMRTLDVTSETSLLHFPFTSNLHLMKVWVFPLGVLGQNVAFTYFKISSGVNIHLKQLFCNPKFSTWLSPLIITDDNRWTVINTLKREVWAFLSHPSPKISWSWANAVKVSFSGNSAQGHIISNCLLGRQQLEDGDGRWKMEKFWFSILSSAGELSVTNAKRVFYVSTRSLS